ncbi:MAG: L-carnitine dehydrogenase [Gammaproteobacteria bacterium]|nr:L-carnitine dehydrogenase [Gammaproteobacteria bacterium]
MTRDINTLAVIGAGVIGAGWAARALAHGLDVVAWDPGADWQVRLEAALETAWPALEKLGLFPGASLQRLRYADSLEQACTAADFIQESAPEWLELKRSLHAEIDANARAGVIIASSTSGLLPSDFQAGCSSPERVIVGHPFNPVYLLPLVEVLGGKETAPEAVDRAVSFYTDLGMYPLRVRAEIEGFLSDRLQEALWREILHLVNDGVADTGELDAAITYGPGLRWAVMGTCLAFHMAGGDAGMRDFMKQFGPALELPWTKLEAPELTDELVDRMVAGTERQAGGRTVKELERLRDDCLIDIMRALQRYRVGAGAVLAREEERIRTMGSE